MDSVKGVLHDIKNEVGVIIGFVDVFIDTMETNEPLKNAMNSDPFLAEMPARNRYRLEQCVGRINDLETAIHRSKDKVPTEKLIVKDQIAVIGKFAEMFGLEMHPAELAHSGNCTFHANAPGIERVIKNVVENSKKAQATKIFIEASVSPHTIQLIIKDNGHGMSDLQIQELGFGYSSSEGKGHGVGTELIRDIVHSFGGTVHWASIRQLGTCCAITLRKGDKPDTCESKRDNNYQ